MMTSDFYRKYEPFFGKWHISREIGIGSFGRVFEIYRDDGLGGRVKSALKIIHIPMSDEVLRTQKELQGDEEAVRRFFKNQVDRIIDEIQILQEYRGHSNIVTYQDHQIWEMPREQGIGWDIMIRMELLHPLSEVFDRTDATQLDVVQMWSDISNALVYCEEDGILHRDIKPSNILISDNGRYKLSDFGTAKRVMSGEMVETRVGTPPFMSPEVFNNRRYDRRSDYYSLGRVVYYYLNRKRHAFLPPYPQPVDEDMMMDARERRTKKGEPIPPLPNTTQLLNSVLLRCLEYCPQDRYESAAELSRDIQRILSQDGILLRGMPLSGDIVSETGMVSHIQPPGPVRKNRTRMWAALAAGLLAIGGIGLVIGLRNVINNKAITLWFNHNVAGNQLSLPPGEEVIISGTARRDSQLLIRVNEETELVFANGTTWSYAIPEEDLIFDDQNQISVEYVDGNNGGRTYQFQLNKKETEPEPTPTPTPPPTPAPTATS